MNLYRKYIPKRMRNLLWVCGWQIKVFFRLFFRHIKTGMNYLLHNRDSFENKLIIITKVYNEARNIKEWIEYHKLVGVEKFIIYDNESADNLKEVLQPYIESGEVDYFYQEGNLLDIQVELVNRAINMYRNKAKWIAIIDLDEFIVPVKRENILDAISDIEKNLGRKIPALAINWVMYGYSGHRTKPNGLVIENFNRNDGVNLHIKSIINPRLVSFCAIHEAICLFGIPQVTERGIAVRSGKLNDFQEVGIDNLRINHYYTKSFEESIQKIIKYHSILNIKEIKIPEFDPDYLSHYYDPIMEKFVSRVKEAVSENL